MLPITPNSESDDFAVAPAAATSPAYGVVHADVKINDMATALTEEGGVELSSVKQEEVEDQKPVVSVDDEFDALVRQNGHAAPALKTETTEDFLEATDIKR